VISHGGGGDDMHADGLATVFILCSQSGSGLGWPESGHADLGAAQAAAETAAGHALQWIPDRERERTWITLFPDDWMIRAVELQPGRSFG
jgi:hypothetical protein